MNMCDATTTHTFTDGGTNEADAETGKPDESHQDKRSQPQIETQNSDGSSENSSMIANEPRGVLELRPKCLHLVDDLIQKLQPHPRAEVHRQQVFEYVKKIIERAVQETSELPEEPLQQPEQLSNLPAPAEVHVCRFG
jgi:hypothetical protein